MSSTLINKAKTVAETKWQISRTKISINSENALLTSSAIQSFGISDNNNYFNLYAELIIWQHFWEHSSFHKIHPLMSGFMAQNGQLFQ